MFLGACPSNPNTLLAGALSARVFQIIGVFAGEAGLPGACSGYSDTLLVRADNFGRDQLRE